MMHIHIYYFYIPLCKSSILSGFVKLSQTELSFQSRPRLKKVREPVTDRELPAD